MPSITGVTKEFMDELYGKTLYLIGVDSETGILTTLYNDGTAISGWNIKGAVGPPGTAVVQNQAYLDAAVADVSPGAWQAFPNDPLIAVPYATSTYGPVQYRLEQDRIRFDGILQYKGSPYTNHGGAAEAVYLNATALPAQYTPPDTRIQGVSNQGHIYDLRYGVGGQLYIIIHNGNTLELDDQIPLNVTFPLT